MSKDYSSKLPSEYRPISMWGYFGYQILFAIPVVGSIFIIIFALSADNINLRNFARSQFCIFIIWFAVLMVGAVTGVLSSMFEAMLH